MNSHVSALSAAHSIDWSSQLALFLPLMFAFAESYAIWVFSGERFALLQDLLVSASDPSRRILLEILHLLLPPFLFKTTR